MNAQNNRIKQLIKNKLIELVIILFTEVLALFSFKFSFNEFINNQTINSQILNNNMQTINIIIFLLLLSSNIVIVINYYIYIKQVKYFIDFSPFQGTIEDFIVVSNGYYKSPSGFRSRNYKIYPVVKINNKLYFTCRGDCIGFLNQKYVVFNDRFTDVRIRRKDKSEIKIGDTAYLYIKKEVSVNLFVDTEKNMFKLNDEEPEDFQNFNKNYDINIMNNLTFFEGIVEIGDENKQ